MKTISSNFRVGYIPLNADFVKAADIHWDSVSWKSNELAIYVLELTFFLSHLLNTMAVFQTEEGYSVGNLNPLSPQKDIGKSATQM